MRFGTLVADEEAAARAVAEGSEELLAGLERVRGAVELALRVNPTEEEPRGASRDRAHDYLRAKLAPDPRSPPRCTSRWPRSRAPRRRNGPASLLRASG